jgi:hypothetical protein
LDLETNDVWMKLAIITIPLVVVLVAGWAIRRHQKDIDDYEEREYREPPVFQRPEGPTGENQPAN